MVKQETVQFQKSQNVNCTHKLMAFAFQGNPNGIDIKIIGSLEIIPAPRQPAYSKGTVQFEDNIYSVFDLQALSDLNPKEITKDSCIVLLDPNDSFTKFTRAIIVDNVTEMLRIAKHDLSGLPLDSLFGYPWQCRPQKPATDFPDIEEEKGDDFFSEESKYFAKKYATGRI